MHITLLGGGISGCISAFTLARAGHAVTLIEKETLGAGASGAALGGLFPYTSNITTKLATVQRQSIAAWPALAAQLAGVSGTPLDTFFRDFGHAKQVNTQAIFPILRTALQTSGVTIRENTPVTELPSGPTLLALGWGNKALAPEATADLHIKQGQALKLAWEGELPAPLYGEEIYILPGWEEGTILVGSSKRRMDAPPATPEMSDIFVTENLLARAERLLPGAAKSNIIQSWVGYRPTQSPILPLIRPTKHRQTHAVAGLGGMGYCLAPAVAQAALAAFEATN